MSSPREPLTFHALGTTSKKPLVLGLVWRDVLDPAEIGQIVADMDADLGVRIEHDGRTTLGLALKGKASASPGDRTKRTAAGLVSAAGWLAHSLASNEVRTVYVHVLPDVDRAWVVSVHRGSVDDRSDVLVRSDDLHETVQTLVEGSVEVGQEVRVIASGLDPRLLQQARWGGFASLGDFAALVLPAGAKPARIQSLRGPTAAKRAVTWLVILAVFGGVFWWDHHRREQKRLAAEAPVADSAEVARLRDERIAAVVSQALISDAATPEVAALVDACKLRLGTVFASTGQWTPSRGSCDAQQMQIQFQRAGPWSVIGSGVAAGRRHGASVQFGPTDSTLGWSWPAGLSMRPTHQGLPAMDTAALSQVLQGLPSHQQLLTSYFTGLQRAAFAWGDLAQVSPPAAKGLQYADPSVQQQEGVPPVMIPVPPEYGYQVTTITLTVPTLTRLEGVLQKVAPLWFVGVEKVETNWSSRGWRYAVRLRVLVREGA